MKTLLSMMIAVGTLYSVNAQATEYHFVAKDTSVETTLCMVATKNDVRLMKQELRRLGERLIVVQQTVLCNQMPIADFADEYGFTQVAQYMNPAKTVQDVAVVRR